VVVDAVLDRSVIATTANTTPAMPDHTRYANLIDSPSLRCPATRRQLAARRYAIRSSG
jgi:hypothetical protein